ncbi:hypothetical protein [Roseivirga sp.]|uniref:hypothetical protein n=1 Tax=Roseivirga sp. TaxID=1964215 RepID=UPI003B518969
MRHLLFKSLFVFTGLLISFNAEKEYLRYLRSYAPNSLGMLQLLENTPSNFEINGMTIRQRMTFDPGVYFDNGTEEEKISSLKTIIHESHHQFNSSYALKLLSDAPPADYQFRDDYSAFYYADDDIILVKHSEVFNSNVLKKEIPKALQSFRYSPYIAPKSNLGSQVQGIYGLMDEFHSYYLGTRTGMESFSYFEKKAENDISAYLEFVSSMSGSYWAFYEFKYFCLMYLKKAQEEHPDIYQQLLANTQLRKIYTKTSGNFERLIETFHQKEKSILALAESKGINAKIEDGYFWIGNRGVGNTGEKTEALIKSLSSPELMALHESFLLKNY